MSTDGIARICPRRRCRSTDISGPLYLREDNRLRCTCRGCGFWWTTPTKEQRDRDLLSAQNNRTKFDD